MVVFLFAQTLAAYMLSVVKHLQCLSVEYEERVTIHGVPASKPANSIRLNQRYPEESASAVSFRRMVMPAPFLQHASHAPQSTRQYLGSYISFGRQAQGVGRQIRT
jgi:hypothetical protein